MLAWSDCLEVDSAVQQRYISHEDAAQITHLGIFLGGIIDAQGHFLMRQNRPHYSVLVYTLEGQGRLLTPDGEHIIHEQSLSILPANTLSGLALDSERWRFAWLSLYNRNRWQQCSQLPLGVDSCAFVPSIYHMLSGLHYELKRCADDSSAHQACAKVILDLVDQSLQQKGQFDIAHTRIKKLFSDVEQQLQYPWTVEEMAEKTHYSVPHFHRLCSKYLNCSPKQYIFQLKMERAKQLITVHRYNVAQVAAHLGYSETSSFSHGFKKYFGFAPSALCRR